MSYKKNKSKMAQDSFADKFNHKKTIHNDNKRVQNINIKSNSVIKAEISEFNNIIDITDIEIHKQILSNITHMPKITCKEIFVPPHLESENFNFTMINKNIKTDIESHNQILSNSIHMPKITCKANFLPQYLESENFDFTMINKNINTHIEMISEDKINLPVSVELLHKKGVTVINNVYQELYKDNTKPTGFGDFIRGCYYLLQFCKNNRFKPKVFVYSQVSDFLVNYCENSKLSKNINQRFLSSIPMFVKNNWVDCILDSNNYIVDSIKTNIIQEDFVRYLCDDVKVYSKNIFIYNIMFPEDNQITKDDKLYIQKMLQPTHEMSQYVDQTLKGLRFQKYKYNVIHIRSGDKFLCDNSKIFPRDYIKKIIDEVFILLNNNNTNDNICDYLLIADNNEIKIILMEYYPNIKSLILDITHLGQETVLERKKVKNTMLDFYLLANSSAIHSFTSYPHGSGFSYWCAKTYEVPYSCMYIKI